MITLSQLRRGSIKFLNDRLGIVIQRRHRRYYLMDGYSDNTIAFLGNTRNELFMLLATCFDPSELGKTLKEQYVRNFMQFDELKGYDLDSVQKNYRSDLTGYSSPTDFIRMSVIERDLGIA